jgi:acetyl esterase/lipase
MSAPDPVTLDPHVRRFLAILAAGGQQTLTGTGVAQRRAALEELMALGGPKPAVDAAVDATIPGPAGPLPIRIYTPPQPLDTPSPGLIYLHGGGLVAGSLDTHDRIARSLALAGACRVVSVGYRLAPEHPYPAGLADAQGAVEHLAGHAVDFGLDGARLGLCGDSAGGTLAAVICQRIARAGGPRLALLLLLCPILDHDPVTTAGRNFSHGDPVDRATLDHDLEHYLPHGADRSHPEISPLAAVDLTGLPPTVIHTAQCDPLCDDGRRYADRLQAAGGAVLYRCHPGMIHLFYGLGGVIPYARRVYEQIGADVRAAWA